MENVIAVTQADELRCEQRPACRLDRGLRLRVDDVLRLPFPFVVGETGEIGHGKRDRKRRFDELHGPPLLHGEMRAQDLVPANDLAERALEERCAKLSAQPESDWDVVRGALSHHLVDEQEPLLRERASVYATSADERRQARLGRGRPAGGLDLVRERRDGRFLEERAKGSSTPSSFATRSIMRAASKECPPKAKKLSSLPTRSTPRRSLHMAAMA